MKILLVNDDGYTAEGILLLEKVLNKYGEVYVVAPYKHMSGKSIGLTIFEELKVHKFDDHHYAIDGTPADCTSFGLTALDIKFDLVASGINEGWNLTYDILHSGTIGACVEALMYEVPAIAFSVEYNLDFMKDYLEMAMEWVLKNNLINKEHIVNINFPNINEVKGIKLGKVTLRKDNRYFYYKDGIAIPRRTIDDYKKYDHESEFYLTNEGYISVSLLRGDFYDENRFNCYKKLIKD